jgi:hypothetical protein
MCAAAPSQPQMVARASKRKIFPVSHFACTDFGFWAIENGG